MAPLAATQMERPISTFISFDAPERADNLAGRLTRVDVGTVGGPVGAQLGAPDKWSSLFFSCFCQLGSSARRPERHETEREEQ